MTDKEIIALYFKRSENAIEQTDVKYGKLCHSISINILNDTRDSEECVNDTYLTLWNKIPPKEGVNMGKKSLLTKEDIDILESWADGYRRMLSVFLRYLYSK